MRRIVLFVLVALLSVLAGCSLAGVNSGERGYTLVYLKTGARTGLTKEESSTIFAGHFANMQRLAHERKLLLAGPFGKEKHDAALRGLFVLATDDPQEAAAWAESDPGFQAQVFALEYHPFRTHAALPALLERELAREAAEIAAGKPSAPGAGMRSYVLLNAENGEALEREAAGHAAVLLHARRSDGHGWAILDATDVAGATAALGAGLERVGAHSFDQWFATGEIVNLPSLSN